MTRDTFTQKSSFLDGLRPFRKGGADVVYAREFQTLLGLTDIRTPLDIQARLIPADSARFGEAALKLIKETVPFTLIVQDADKTRFFKISGAPTLCARKPQNMIWIEDVTEAQRVEEQARAEEERAKQTAQEKILRLARLERAFDSIPAPRWLRDKEGTLVWVNQAYADAAEADLQTVLTEQRELSSTPRKIKDQKTKPLGGRALANMALESNQPQSVEAYVVVGGKRILMQIIEMPLPHLDTTLGITEDISALDELRTALKRTEFSNKELLEHLRSAIALYDSGERLEFYNAAFAQLWGLEGGWLNTRPKLGEIMEKLRETRRLPEQTDFRRFKQSWLNMFTGLIAPHEEMLYTPDGSALRMLVIPHSMGGLMMIFEDVTSRLELESSYNTLIAVQKETLDNLAEAVAVYGGNGRLRLWNPACAKLWGLHPEDLDGEPHITSLVDKVNRYFTKEEWPQRREEIISNALGHVMREGRFKRTDESLVDFTTVPLPDGGTLVTYTDVTDTVRVENALREKNAALEAAEQLKMDFLANVSYQLRTPLNAIMGFNEILNQEYFGPLNPRQKEYTQDMHKASERLLELINDILDLATLEAGYMMLERTDVKINELLGSIMDLVSDWARKTAIEVHFHCPPDIGTITADETRFKQAIINVIRNAIAFTPAGGRIDLTARKTEGGIEIEIKDTGVGIEKEDRKRIFEPFERAQNGVGEARLTRTGTGVGLSLVRNIMMLHGGHVSLESETGKGTRVVLFIPYSFVPTGLKIPVIQRYEDAI